MASAQVAARTKAIRSRCAAGTPAIQLSYFGLSLSSAMARARAGGLSLLHAAAATSMCPKSFQACAGVLAIARRARAAGAMIFIARLCAGETGAAADPSAVAATFSHKLYILFATIKQVGPRTPAHAGCGARACVLRAAITISDRVTQPSVCSKFHSVA